MKKLKTTLLLFFIFTQFSFSQVRYNDCEIKPSLKNRKNFVNEIIKDLNPQKDVEISFYVDKNGNFFAITVDDYNYHEKIKKTLTRLGEWNAGEFNNQKVVVLINFKIKLDYD